MTLGWDGEPVFAQAFRTQTAPPGIQSFEARQAFQAMIDEQARLLASDDRLAHLSQHKRQALIEFVAGNMLVAAMHQLGLAILSELSVPSIGGADQGADDFSILAALELGKSHFSDRILTEAAKGEFNRMRSERITTDSYERSRSVRRAYRMVCLMAGADARRFRTLIEETSLPRNLQRNCGWDYESALRSWTIVLRPYRPVAEQPKTRIDVSYGVAAGSLAPYAQVLRNLHFLEAIAEAGAGQITWRAPLLIEMRSCGATEATWSASTRTLGLCYEMAEDFAKLYLGVEHGHR